MRLLLVSLTAATAAALPAGAQARDAWSLRSPSGELRAEVRRGGDGLRLTVRRARRVALRADLGVDPRRPRARRGRVDHRFTTPSGKRRAHRLRARRLELRGRGRVGAEILLADDGVAFRVRGGRRDAVALRPPFGARAWLQVYRGDYEGSYDRTALATAPPGRYAFPALLRGGGSWTLLTESGLAYGDAASHLEADAGTLRVALPRGGEEPHRSPWRVAVIGDRATVVGSSLPLALGRPSRVADPSWIQPGRVAWSWWSDPRSPSRPERQREYVDAAQRAGWEYVLVDAGWHPAWIPDFVAYARERGVRVLLWFDWHALATEEQRTATLSQLAAWGVAGVKVDFLLSDKAERIRVYDDIARVAAAHRLVVGFHGSTVPRGIQRTWPNVLTLEAVKGSEHAMTGAPMDPAHNVNLVFTRNVLGAMDYTPVAFSAANRRTTAAHELALAVAYESGLQHYADSPESYARHPHALALLRRLPAAWDDTRLLGGHPDRFAVVARRSGDRWYVGALVAGAGRLVRVPLDFLAPGRTYTARVVADDGHGSVLTVEVPVDASGLSIPTLPDGGFTIELIGPDAPEAERLAARPAFSR